MEPNIAAGHTVHVFVYLSRDDMGGMHNHYHWSRASLNEGVGGGGGEAARRQRPGRAECACNTPRVPAIARLECLR